MQAVAHTKAFAGSAVRAAATTPRAARCAVVVRASAEEGRRAVLGGLMAGVVALTASSAQALDLFDDRSARERGFDIIYEARDLDLPQGQRDGMSQIRTDLGLAKKRIVEAEKRIDADVTAFVEKKYWTEGRNELRRQVGTLRFDINAIADTLPKASKKELLAAKKEFLSKVDELDFAMRKKSPEAAAKALTATKTSLDAVLTKLA